MKYAILAAGEGSRLAEEGVPLPKPLVRLCGEPMIDRLVRVFTQCGASEIDIILNDLHASTLEHLSRVCKKNPLVRLKVKSTPSSMHSFYELMPLLGEGKFCLTTVDTIFREQEFREFISQFEHSEADGMMAVTSFVDDEKPLYISTDAGLRITGFHDNIPADGLYLRHNNGAVPHTGGVACGSTPGYESVAPSGLPLATCKQTPLSGLATPQAIPSGLGSPQITPKGLPLATCKQTPLSGLATPQAIPSGLGSPQITPKGFPLRSRGLSEAEPPDQGRSYVSAERSCKREKSSLLALPSAAECRRRPGTAHICGEYGLCQFVSGGIYCLSDKAFPTLVRCIEAGKSRMRNFQRQLIEDGLRLVAYPFSKILDVDHASDIPKAEAFLRGL